MNLASDSYVLAVSILVAVYAAVILFFVVRGALRIKSMQDYAVGNVKFSPVAVGLALAASLTSAATFIINPGFIGLYGLSGVFSFGVVMPLAIFGSLIIFTKGFRKHGASIKATTMAQWMGNMYGSRAYGLFFAVLSLLLITFIVLICVGLTQVLSQALNAEPIYVLAVIIAFIFGYMMFGGANSMVYTNAIQAVLMAIVAVILLTSGYDHFSEGVSGFLAKLEAIDPNLVKSTNPNSFLFRDYFEIIFCQAVIGIAIVCQPHVITKSLLLKSDKDVNRYLGVGISVLVLFFLVVFVGLYARIAFPDMQANGEALPMDGLVSAYVVSEFPVYVGLVVVLGLLSAGLSTLEGLIQSLSSTITSDLIRPLAGKKLYPEGKENREMLVNKLVIVVLAVASFFFSRQQLLHPNLSVGIFAQNGVYAYFSAAFVPVLFGMFFRQARLTTVWLASLVALVVHFGVYYGNITPYMQGPVNNPAIASTIALLSSVGVGMLRYYLMDRPQAQKQLKTTHG